MSSLFDSIKSSYRIDGRGVEKGEHESVQRNALYTHLPSIAPLSCVLLNGLITVLLPTESIGNMTTFASLRELEKARNKKPDRGYSVEVRNCALHVISTDLTRVFSLTGVINERFAVCPKRMESRWSIDVDHYDHYAYYTSTIEY